MRSRKRPKHSSKKLQEINERDGFECRYCGTPLDPETITYDHVIAFVSGGSESVENLVSACRRCNTLKCDYSVDKFLERIAAKFEVAHADVEYYKRILERAGTV